MSSLASFIGEYVARCLIEVGFASTGTLGSYLVADLLDSLRITYRLKCGLVNILPDHVLQIHTWIETQGVIVDVGLLVNQSLFNQDLVCIYDCRNVYSYTRENREVEDEFNDTHQNRELYWKMCDEKIMELVTTIKACLPLALVLYPRSRTPPIKSSSPTHI